jgi:hypothetical protein
VNQQAQVVENYGKIALNFEANTGQMNSSVKFLSHVRGYTLFLTSDGAVLALKEAESGIKNQEARRAKLENRNSKFQTRKSKIETRNSKIEIRNSKIETRKPTRAPGASSVLCMRFLGANPDAKVTGETELPGKANYLIGNDPKKWRVGVPTYATVRDAGIYPGIDLVYYGNQQQLEFDFVVAPGVDPSAIALGVRAGMAPVPQTPDRPQGPPLQIAADGDLVIPTKGGEVRFHRPQVYQVVNGDRHLVAGDFALLGKHTVGFRLGSYDRAQALVIDPALAYSTLLGGSGFFGDAGNAIAVDAAGDVYVAGSTTSANFPVTSGAYQTTNNAAANQSINAFVSKLNPTGTELVYSTYLGGSGGEGNYIGGDIANAIAADAAGNVYLAGQTYSSDFPVTQGAFQTTNRAAANGDPNAFVTKLNATGTALVYSTYLGGSGLAAVTPYSGDYGKAIALDAAGDAYVAGEAYSVDFPVTPGAFQTTNHAAANVNSNAFVSKLNPSGTELVYSTYLGGSTGPGGYENDKGHAIAVDAAGDAYVAGETFSSDFPITAGAYQTTNHALANRSTNAFITELNPTGTGLVYSTYLGGSGYATLGPASGDKGNAIAIDSAGNAYVAGATYSTDFPVTNGAFQTTNHATHLNNNMNAFIAKLNPAGTELVYSTYLGGSGGTVILSPTLFLTTGDVAAGLAVDTSGNAYVTGSTPSPDFPVTQDASQKTNNDQTNCASGGCIGGYNAFITELNSSGSALVHSTYLGGSGYNPAGSVGLGISGMGDQAMALALDNSGNAYVTGSAISYDFPATAGAFQTTVNSRSGNAFVTKLNMSATSTAAKPTVTVTPGSSTITTGRPLPVTVSVSGGNSSPEPTGTVTLASGTYASAAATLSGGSATIDVPAGALIGQPAGFLDGLFAKYVPDTASSSTYSSAVGRGTVSVVAPNISLTPSSTNLTWAQAQAQPLTVAIAATGGTGIATPAGTVTLTTGSYSSAATPLVGGNATITVPPATLTIGFNTLNLSYGGDSNYAAMPNAAGGLVIVGATVSVSPSSTSVNYDQALPVAITVSGGSSSPTATGTVTLSCGAYDSAATPLVNGSATITVPAETLNTGLDTLLASYAGGNYPSASGLATVTVIGGSPGFKITGTAVIVTAGASTGNTSLISVTPTDRFAGTVALTAALTSSPTGAQDLPTFSFGGNTQVNISGAAPATAPLTITTTEGFACTQAYVMRPEIFWYTGGSAALACLLLFGIPATRRRWRLGLITLALLATLMEGLVSCGGNSGPNCTPIPGTTSGTYIITVTGTSGATTSTGTVTLTVQ